MTLAGIELPNDGAWDEATRERLRNGDGASFRGTLDVPVNILDSLESNVTQSGYWLPSGKNFYTFAFELWTTRRTTNGRHKGGENRQHIELIEISCSP